MCYSYASTYRCSHTPREETIARSTQSTTTNTAHAGTPPTTPTSATLFHRHLLRTQLHAAIQTRKPGTATAARTRATSTPSATAEACNTSTTCAQSARPARGASSIRSSSRTRSRRTGSRCTRTCSRLGRRSSWSSRGRRSRLMLRWQGFNRRGK